MAYVVSFNDDEERDGTDPNWETEEAERWIINDQGLYGIFRREARRGGDALHELADEIGFDKITGIYENNRDPEPIDWDYIAGELR